eukprot:IDg12524t1
MEEDAAFLLPRETETISHRNRNEKHSFISFDMASCVDARQTLRSSIKFYVLDDWSHGFPPPRITLCKVDHQRISGLDGLLPLRLGQEGAVGLGTAATEVAQPAASGASS